MTGNALLSDGEGILICAIKGHPWRTAKDMMKRNRHRSGSTRRFGNQLYYDRYLSILVSLDFEYILYSVQHSLEKDKTR